MMCPPTTFTDAPVTRQCGPGGVGYRALISSAKHMGRLERMRCDGGVTKAVGMSDDGRMLNVAQIVESSG